MLGKNTIYKNEDGIIEIWVVVNGKPDNQSEADSSTILQKGQTDIISNNYINVFKQGDRVQTGVRSSSKDGKLNVVIASFTG